MVKVLVLVNELLRGGAQRIILDIAQRIDRSKFTLHVAFLKAEDVFPPETKSLLRELLSTGVQVTSIGGRQKFSSAEFRSLRRLLRQVRPDIVHTFLPYAGTLGRIAARSVGIRNVISTQCNLPVAYGARVYWLDRLTLPLAKAWTGATEGIEQAYGGSVAHFSRELWSGGRRHFSIPGGVDLEKIKAAVAATDRQAKRAELGIDPGQTLVLMTARLISWKGHRYAIEAMPYLPPDLHLAFVGWGPLAEQLKQLAASLGVASRVHFLGARSDVYELLAAADMYLQTHSCEAGGKVWMGPNLSQVEAAAAEVPAVSSAVPLVEYLVEDGVTGTLARVNDAEDTARAIRWVIEHPAEAKSYAGAAARRVEELYTIQRMVRRYEQLYSASVGAAE